MRPTKSRSWFTRLTKGTAHVSGRPLTFVVAASVILAWAITGPLFHFSDTWQLVIHTGTTIVTFLMVFLIQSTQNRDTEAVQVKLDEVIRAIATAQNELLDLEELEEADLDRIRESYRQLARNAREASDGSEPVRRRRRALFPMTSEVDGAIVGEGRDPTSHRREVTSEFRDSRVRE
jgi:low affinity Fe/Cu permease